MKKFISFVMAAAMVASLVPATAFAKGEVSATAKVVDAKEFMKGTNGVINGYDVPELQLKVNSVDYQQTSGTEPTMDVTVSLDNAEFQSASDVTNGITVTGTGASKAQYVYTKVADNSNAPANNTAIAAMVKAYFDTDGKTDVNLKKAPIATPVDPVTVAAPEGSKFTLKANGNLPTMMTGGKTAAVVRTDAIDAYIKSLDAANTATNANYTFMPVSVFGEKVYEKDASATTGPAFFKQADFLRYAGVGSEADFVAVPGTKITPAGYAAWEALAVTAVKTAIGAADFLFTEKASLVAGGSAPTFVVNPTTYPTDEVTVTFTGYFAKDMLVSFDLTSTMKSTAVGKKALVSVDSKMAVADDLVYATVVDKGIKASIKSTIDIAEEEVSKLHSKGLVIEPVIAGSYAAGDTIELKLSSGFEFVARSVSTPNVTANATAAAANWTPDGNTATFTIPALGTDEKMTVTGIEIESTSAKSGAVATMKVTAKHPVSASGKTTYETLGTASVEVAKVVDYKVVLSVDADQDVPVIYSGVNSENFGITDDSDHMSLEVTANETFPGAWSMRQGFNFTLPDGVYVTDVNVVSTEEFYRTNASNVRNEVTELQWEEAFFDAYQKGEHKNFEFIKRVFDDVNTTLATKKATVTFELELVADPTFEGDVVLGLEGDLLDKQEVTIAKFVKPYIAKAEQNDVIIDYRNTAITTPITITEAATGLWSKDAEFTFTVDRGDMIQFEKDAKFAADEKSSMTVKADTTPKAGTLEFTVKDESEDSAATVTINEIELFMQRNVPAGTYKLEVTSNLNDAYDNEAIFAADESTFATKTHVSATHDKDKDCTVGDVNDYEKTVKESFVNVITAGRDQDDASFTTKIVVPVGEKYLIAGETKVDLEVAAYISAAGYTMLPVRAVATALGINNNNVLWNAESRTITILYGQRIITMVVGQKIVNVNGSAIPTSASPEIKEGRAFLPMRDLATALGVTDITWDQATKTATMNGSK